MLSERNDILLHTLLDISQQINETRAVMPLLRYAVDVSIELLEATHGFIILVDKQQHFAFPVARDANRQTVIDPESQISRTILFRTIDDRQHIITASAIKDERYDDSESVQKLRIKSVMCVPLIAAGDVLGAIYMENRNEADAFSKEQLQPLHYLAGQTALCLKNAMLEAEVESLRAQQVEQLADTNDNTQLTHQAVQRTLDEQRNRLLNDFVRDTSHHFKTPLTIIKSSVDLLRRKVDQRIAGDYLERIVRQVDTIVNLVDALNLLSKMDARLNQSFVQENLSLMVHDIYDGLKIEARRKNIRMSLDSPDEAVRVTMLPEYVRQAISKVLLNAIQYTGHRGTITIALVNAPDVAMVVITDAGIGIAPEHLQHVTERFYQVDKSGVKRGLGVGLTIADHAMYAHGGELHIESELGVGTQVTLVFPKQQESEDS
ncbi:MAG: GAF domain-containing sensor histidine kinase [Chloroflexota bacterium]